MDKLFQKAHEFTALYEGGYVNHKDDPGGETNLGVTKRVWQKWCADKGIPVKPMRALTMTDVLPLYEARYWPYAAGYPWPLSAVAYDIAVNHGPKNLAYMLGKVATAGTPAERAARLIDVREQFFRDIVRARPSQGVFLKGWLRRVEAQREWLRLNSQPDGGFPTAPRVLLAVPGRPDQPQEWDGKPAVYGGVALSDALIEQLRLLYPQPGGPWDYQNIRIFVRRNGDMVLDKTQA